MKIIIASVGLIAIITGGSIIGYNKYQNYQKTSPNAVIAVVGKQKITKSQWLKGLFCLIYNINYYYYENNKYLCRHKNAI